MPNTYLQVDPLPSHLSQLAILLKLGILFLHRSILQSPPSGSHAISKLSNDTIASPPSQPLRPDLSSTPHANTHPMTTREKASIHKKKAYICQTQLDTIEPTSVKHAFSHPTWTVAMHNEMNALLCNKT